jgi:hypothetical protein
MLNPVTTEKILKHLFGITAFTLPSTVKLHLATAYNAGTGAYTEVVGGSYAAQAVTSANFAVKASKVEIENTAAIQFLNMPACTITHAFIKDAGGNVLAGVTLTTPRTLLAGDHSQFAAGAFVFSITDAA